MRIRTNYITLIYIFVIVGIASFLAGHYLTGEKNSPASAANTATTESQITAPSPTGGEIPFLQEIFAPEATQPDNGPWQERTIIIISRLVLAVVLSTILAFRPRRNLPFFQRNLYVAQTQILLAVVAAALMMIVGDSAARAFAIFAAASLVRFRTNIRDPKEITVLLISLGLGMAAGVGRWELGFALCLFALILLWFLEQQESEQVFRSMELTVKTQNTDKTRAILKKIFRKHKIEAEVREFVPLDENNPIGSITYYLDLPLNLSTDSLSRRIFALDADNVEGITWKHKREKFAG